MKPPSLTQRHNPTQPHRKHRPVWDWATAKPRGLWLVLLGCGLSLLSARAQTVTINPQTLNYWAGVNTSNVLGVGSNSVVMTGADGIATINFAVSGQPGGLTTLFSTNFCTNSISLGLFLAATNVAAGAYPLTISGSGAASYSTNVNFFVVNQWTQTNGGSIGSWSAGPNWSSGSAPGTSGAVYLENMIPAPFTNVVDSSQTIQSLVYLGDADDAGYANAVNTTINNGVTLSVVGTNGFFIGRKNNSGQRPFYTFSGAGALAVSNAAANFGIVDASANSTRYLTVNMTNLNNLNVTVNRFGIGDVSLSGQQGACNGSQVVNFYAARTNIITALFRDNYTNVDFNTAIQYTRDQVSANGSQAAAFNLGITNSFYADSLGVGRGGANGSGSTPFAFGAYPMRFANAFSNSVAPVAAALFRNSNGGRMSLLAVGVDSGAGQAIAENAGYVDLRGGKVDMLVDQVWLGRNRTNAIAKACLGGLYFDWGTINANTIIAGNMQYTNIVSQILGCLLVGTNGTLDVNSNLVLGLTPANVTGFAAQAAAVSGQVQINNGGTLRASQITVGQNSATNGIITINNGGTLDVTNTIASASTMLTTLTAAGGGLTLHVTGNSTLVYVSNLTASTASPINIASVSGISSFPVTIHIIAYATATTPNNWIGGTAPAGLTVAVANNSGNSSIDVTLSTGAPKTLLWKGYVNNIWDNSTYNWLDLHTGLHTNFATLDKVAFDDTSANPNIVISGDMVPSQSADGMQLTNNLLSYTFTTASSGDGSGRILGGASLTVSGTNSLTVDLYAEFNATVNAGSLLTTANGTVGAATVATGAEFFNGGTVLGGVICAGTSVNSSTIAGAVAIQTSGVVTNWATVNGALAMQSGSLLYNAGTFYAIGSATTGTNSTLINDGTLYGSSLTINGTLVDIAPDSIGVAPGSINLGTLTINGTFEPGGNAIGTTKVTDYAANGNQLGNPNGRIQFAAGSQTILQVNTANSQPNTLILSQNQGFGPSEVAKAINGGTLVITNVGTSPFTIGQTFQFFAAYYTGGNIGNAGLNTTNAYPLIQPSVPGPGLVWDLSQLYASGTIGVISAASVQMALTSTMSLVGTNLVTELSWPAGFIGNGWVQEQTATLATGLGTNWSNLGPSAYVNDILLTNVVSGSSAVFYRFVIP